MRLTFLILLISNFSLLASEEVKLGELITNPYTHNDDEPFRLMLPFGETKTIPAYFWMTGKGNGVLKIGSTHIRVYDQHPDPEIYQGGFLTLMLSDLTGNGQKELIMHGIIAALEEDGDDVAHTRSALSIWRLKSDTSGLVELVSDRSIYSHDTEDEDGF